MLAIGVSYADSSNNNATLTDNNQPSNEAFQEFDNQYYLGYNYLYGNAQSGYGQTASYGANNIGFGIERLFDNNVWFAFDGTMMVSTTNLTPNNPNTQTIPTLGINPAFANMNAKIGYAIPILKDELQVIPYGLFGRNTNISTNSISNNLNPDQGGTSGLTNATNDYFLSAGIGGRLEYRINKVIDVYFDQNIIYSHDMSQPNVAYNPVNNFAFNSVLGGKFNVWDPVQLGLQAFYNGYVMTQPASAQQQYQLEPQSQVGIMATIGLTY